MIANPDKAHVDFTRQDTLLRVHCTGAWNWSAPHPAMPEEPLWAGLSGVRLEATETTEEDGALLAWLLKFCRVAAERNLAIDTGGLAEGTQKLLALALAVPPRTDHPTDASPGFFASLGGIALRLWSDLPLALAFTGEITQAFGRLLTGKARLRRRDLMWLIEANGPRALPISSLISFLVGTILAYMGAVQLAQFGAQIYIADLVAIGMVREIGALMTGIILAGRTGAAYAAQIGTMQVNEEIDALRTLGISPIDTLVLPRLLALVMMVPLLTLYAGVVGIGAGMLIATTVFGVGIREYLHETVLALSWTHILIGMFKGTVYGALVAFSGCWRGMQCGRSAQAVGEATTSAVVTSILLITVSASVLTILFQRLGW
ncbi:ABC transporter permease [Uliginosibacterium flavum]|uniref:ABC transporter permease n=1 Tax=Uliginosibacterium flavum TaxID=1396831 RepID=A0ABV2TH40_9RHOO